jgi:hypothetical protein
MKKVILFVFLVLTTILSNSQVITVKLDTTQFFEHSALISTPQAIESNKLIYTVLYEHKPNFVVKFDLNNKIESYSGFDNQIIKINDSTNIIDVIVKEGKQESLIVLGKTDEGNIMYIFEYRDGDLIKGFFSKNPEIIYNLY